MDYDISREFVKMEKVSIVTDNEQVEKDNENILEENASESSAIITTATDLENNEQDLKSLNICEDETLYNVNRPDDVKESSEQEDKSNLMFTIGEYGKNDANPGQQPLIRSSTIEELKLKLEKKELLFKPRPGTPSSPSNPDILNNQLAEEVSDDMIPETRTPSLLTDDGLIPPRKPANPVREDPGRQNLHRELLFNQKIGKNVLNQKSELQKALERHKDNVAKKQLEHHIAEKTPELEKVIADRAKRLENPPRKENEEDKVINKEFIQARMKLKSTSDLK